MDEFVKGAKNPAVEDSIVKGKLKLERKNGTRKGALIAGAIGLAVLIIVGVAGYGRFKKMYTAQATAMENQRVSFNQQVNSRDSVINEWLVTFDQIEKDLNVIKQKEKVLNVNNGGKELNRSKREQILDDIKSINALLEADKKKIAYLTAQLNNSGGTIKGLQSRVASLEAQIKTYETDIADLKMNVEKKDAEISQLNVKVSDMETSITQKDNELTSQTNRMNEAYLVSGTYKDLKTKGIVTKDGGFLGLGQRELLASNVNQTMFEKVDMRDIKSIPVNSRNFKLITSHPANSYNVIHEGKNKVAAIEITDPDSFWRMTKYAVVEIIK